MALDTGLAFKFMQVNYKYGLLDEVGSIVGDAFEAVMVEKGMDMEDILNILDGTSEDTIEKIDGLLDRWGTLLFRLAANGPMTRLQAYLLKKPAVRRLAVKVAANQLGKRLVPSGEARR
jgi:hypothetical protein